MEAQSVGGYFTLKLNLFNDIYALHKETLAIVGQ